MGVLVHLHDRFNPTRRNVYQARAAGNGPAPGAEKQKGLRPHTKVYQPGGVERFVQHQAVSGHQHHYARGIATLHLAADRLAQPL